MNADPDDDAVWARVRLIHFPHSHLGREDKQLKERMKEDANLRGVLAWAVEGARRWYGLGAAGLPEPASSRTILAEHRGELDNVGAWLDECTTVDADAFCTNQEVYSGYRLWCENNGITPTQQKGLTQALERKGYKRTPKQGKDEARRGLLRLPLGG